VGAQGGPRAGIVQISPLGVPARSWRATRIGTTALTTSRMKTGMATFLPPARATLVAPMFPEPTVRTSTPRKRRVRMTPNGMEPER
jgi:hypothetical protein